MHWRWAHLSALLICAGCATLPERVTSTAEQAARASRQIVVTVAQNPMHSAVPLGAPERRYQRRSSYRADPAVERVLEQLSREHGLIRVEGWPITSLGVYCEVFEIRSSDSVDALLEVLAEDPRISLAQRMNLFETQASRYDDTYAELQTAALPLDIESAHGMATGRGITVAIIDSGIDATHPELRGRVEVLRDYVTRFGGSSLGEVHGTAVAGVIAATANNREGIVGVAPNASVAGLRACWSVAPQAAKAVCSTFSLAKALEAALNLAPNVLNMSLAGPSDPLLAQLLERIVDRGIIVVTVRADASFRPRTFPASEQGVLVAGPPSAARGTGTLMLLGAPATEILTTTPSASYAFLSGGSLAAAHVSGIVALLVETRPRISAFEIATLLKHTSVSSGGEELVNACNALLALNGAGRCASGSVPISVAGGSRTTD